MKLDEEQKAIVNIIKKYPDALDSRKRFAAIVSDCIPENHAFRIALINAYEEGIVDFIDKGVNGRQTIFQCRKKLEKNRGIAAKYASKAVITMVYICGRLDLLEFDQNEDEITCARDFDIPDISTERIHSQIYSLGEIHYIKRLNGVFIVNIDFKRKLPSNASFAVVLPEEIDGYQVVSILSGAFNEIRKAKCKAIIIPNTVKNVGTKNERLYKEFSEKGVFPKPYVYYARKSYDEYSHVEPFYKNLSANDSEDYFCFEATKEELSTFSFVPLKEFQEKNDRWQYPIDNLWIAGDKLLFYTGTDKKITVKDCKSVSEDVFVNIPAKEIVFGKSVTEFATNMIHDCDSLYRVVFKAKECRYGGEAIGHCRILTEVKWPKEIVANNESLYIKCPNLGNMVLNNRLFTFQSEDEVIVLDEDILNINKKAFVSCERSRIVYIHEKVKEVEYNAFDGSNLEVVIFKGKETRWDVHQFADRKLYVFCHEDSCLMSTLPVYTRPKSVIIKNTKRLEEFLNKNDVDMIKKTCYESMDDESDDEMIYQPYKWDDEVYDMYPGMF